MPSRYSFSEYSPDWPQDFNDEVARLQALLGPELLRAHHIGSTSVPGLAAKPTIDMLPIVRNIDFVESCTPKLEAAGYKPWGEYGIPGRRFFTKDQDDFRTHNIHIFQTGAPEIERHLAFCAYLRSHPDVCDEYAALKHVVYAQHPSDIEAYSAGKDAWIKGVESMALQWYRAHVTADNLCKN